MNDHLLNIPGQSRAKEILSKFISSKKIPHALLFAGPDGVGKDYAAIKFTQELHSSASPNHSSSKAVNQVEHLAEPYIKFIIPLPRGKNETDSSHPTEKLSNEDMGLLKEEMGKKIKNPYYKISLPKANNIKINSIREIKKFLSLDYSELEYRVILISEANLMSDAAQNALLKNLEEPPGNAVFILTTSQPKRLRETIRSRCWRINFDPLDEKNINEILTNRFNIDKQLADAVAPFSEGSVQIANQLIDLDFYNLRERTISILRYSFGKKFHSAFDELNNVLEAQNNQNIKLILKMIITWLSDLNKYKFDPQKFYFSNHIETLEKFNKKFPDVELNEIVVKLDRLSSLIKFNVNTNLLSANLIMELSDITTKHPS